MSFEEGNRTISEGVEETPPQQPQETDEGFPCPHCGTVQKEYWIVGKLRTPKCPTCKKLIRQGVIPEKYIVHVDSKAEQKRKKIAKLRGEEEEGIFIRPRKPEEVLEAVLLDFNLNPEFIELMVRRSRNLGGIHPTDLRNYLKTLKSGVKTPQEADFIADEYYLALQREEQKARELGVSITYPIYSVGQEPSGASPYPVRTGIGTPGYQPQTVRYPMQGQRYGTGYQQGYQGYGQSYSQGLTREDLETMMRTLLFEKAQTEEMNRLRQQQEMMMQSLMTFKSEVAEAIKSVSESGKRSEVDELRMEIREQYRGLTDALTRLVDKIAEIGKPKDEGVVTVDKLETLLTKKELEAEKARAEAEKKAMEARAEMERKMLEERFNRLEQQLLERGATEKMIEELREDFNQTLEDTLRRVSSVKTDDYKSDEFRLVAQSVDRLATAIEQNKPLKEIKDLAVEMIRGGEGKEIPEELKKEIEKTASGVVDILEQIDKEYVVEE